MSSTNKWGNVNPDFVLISAVAVGLGALLPQYAALGVTFAFIDFTVMFAYASAGAQAIRFLRAKGVLWLDRICGGALLALAGSLALYRRHA
jgi:threonine/homoserine/homoserine lactone efflux protein